MRTSERILFPIFALSVGLWLARGSKVPSVHESQVVQAAPPISQIPRRGRGPVPDLRPQLQSILEEWRSAVADHNAGEMDRAARDVSEWFPYRLSFAVSQVCQLSASLSKSHLPGDARLAQDLLGLSKEEAAQGNPNRVLKRGALLLTDIAILGPQRSGGYRAGGSQVLVGDGLPVGFRNESFYWALARQLLAAVRPSPGLDPTVRQWYAATAADMQHRRQWGDAILHLNQAAKTFPTDALFSFYIGAVHEFLAGPKIQNAAVVAPNANLDVGSRERELKSAQFYYQLAVDADREFAEAHLWLGRTAGLLGNHATALAELKIAQTKLQDAPLQYYAALFPGREHESCAEYAAAREQFDIASSFYPTAQSPLLALSYLERWSPDSSRRYKVMEQILTWSDQKSLLQDPWWGYDVSHVRDAEALMAEMRKTIGGLPR